MSLEIRKNCIPTNALENWIYITQLWTHNLRPKEIWKHSSFHSHWKFACTTVFDFYVGDVWPLKTDANRSRYNETSPVLISYLSTNSGSGGSLCLIASLKSHKAVWHSQDANPSQQGHFWWGWGGDLWGRQAAMARRKKKSPCQTELSSGEPRCQHPWGAGAGSKSSSRLIHPTTSWARQLAVAPVDSTFLSQWLFCSSPPPPLLLLFRSVFTSLEIPSARLPVGPVRAIQPSTHFSESTGSLPEHSCRPHCWKKKMKMPTFLITLINSAGK